MKRTILSALALVALASCSKSDETSFTTTDSEVRISSSIATRTIANAWEAGDGIGVYMTTNGGTANFDLGENVLYTTAKNDGAFTSTTPLYYPSSNNVDLLAYYPYVESTEAKTFDVAAYEVDVATQTDQGGIDLMKAETTTSKSSSAVEMTFYHKLSRIALTIKNGGGVEASELKNLVVTLSGTATTADFDLTTESISNTGDVKDITMLTAENGLSSEAIVIPQSLSGAMLKFETKDATTGNTVNTYYASLATTAFEIGKEYLYTVTITNTDVTISSPTIKEWGDGSEGTSTGDDDLTAEPVAKC